MKPFFYERQRIPKTDNNNTKCGTQIDKAKMTLLLVKPLLV